MITLGIESSCDETSVAVVRNGREVLSNIIATQIEVHQKFGGVVPEIASRKHVEAFNPVLDQALEEANISLEDIDIIGATRGPGLIGALLVGLSGAKALSFALKKPFIGVNHMDGHVCANYLSHPELEPPFTGLIVSGGHTYLIDVTDYTTFELIGRTIDDAAGEAFDKVARAMGIGYPGGPIIDKLSKKGNPKAMEFPRIWLKKEEFDFSFSGLKTAVINELNTLHQKGISIPVEDVCASFQQAVIDVLATKTMALAKKKGRDTIVLSGGVSANSGLREEMETRCKKEGLKLYYPELKYCTDNGAMIASATYYNYQSGNYDTLGMAEANLGLE
ncbi:MAG: tRNA (adenosine(37)-N6)-threonylcarbamoyltransferase complex transferase subunit TsaD [Tissierellia bacterium]|nr:tRNA (adenosine(37)-N6)-threonylcarbamoyltransferase complex transferase subunit TsaD [Tissierellia bacterium]